MLQPRLEPAGYVLLAEMEVSLEVIFIMKGIIQVGYEINKVKHMALEIETDLDENNKENGYWKRNGNVVGAYHVTFGKRSSYYWVCKT